MGRRLLYPEKMEGSFPEGTFAGIDDVLAEDEARTDFVRLAVQREIALRQARTVAVQPAALKSSRARRKRAQMPSE